MQEEDIDEDFEYAGNCTICENMLDMSEAGFCDSCGAAFCWGSHGGWDGGVHKCQFCIVADEDD